METVIKFKGKEYRTKTKITHLTDEEFENIKNEYLQKPPKEEVVEQLKKIHNGGQQIGKVVDYFLKLVMGEVVCSRSRWCTNDVFRCKQIMEYYYSQTLSNKKMFNSENTLKNIIKAISIGSEGVARKATNYPIKSVREILKLYNVNNNYYDYSCGWASRMLGSLSVGINYYGTDPNYQLTKRLKSIEKAYKQVNNVDTIVDIRTQGSEHFVPEWENKMGMAFSSPPYFDLEDYKIGDQSINYGTYDAWLEKYFKQTILNIKRYLVKDGYFILNTKDIKEYALLTDSIKIAESLGFEIYEIHELKNITRTHCNPKVDENGKKIFKNNNEKIVVFKQTS